MVLITIVTGAYKPTYNWGASHCMYFLRNWNSQLAGLDLTVPASRWYLHIFPSNLGFYPGKRVWHDSSVWGESRAGLLHCTSCWPLGSFKLFVLVSCSFVTYSWTLCLFIYLSIYLYVYMHGWMYDWFQWVYRFSMVMATTPVIVSPDHLSRLRLFVQTPSRCNSLGFKLAWT